LRGRLDPQCHLDSFGFGGQNVSLVMAREPS